ncbi:conserved Plasmodium protein, unknown function [Plasmodium vinckei vinckei]|uniref:Uncharacterized protein n=1 Tax=Plasmodium vinckei vinckei TaxID=54757 RepID=A0A449C094_PLAVN|nr:conserved Plasmodium protein, unknown function [Plasmodium vinckei vinckei]KEG04099.1 hypothetical protein YYE_01001 [Plasmodium vinckei vinckei]VEV59103.1 conserved Plasmodium protein, unknown function [Plasmodium vinckei vinckei]
MLKNYFKSIFRFPQKCVDAYVSNYKNEFLKTNIFHYNSLIFNKNHCAVNRITNLHFFYLKYKFNFILNSNISTKRRRYFKIRKHQKKKYKKKRMGLSTIPWIPKKEKIRTYKLPNQSRLINKRFMRDKKGGRRYRLKKQR